ncbi:MAG TPA: hydantoinase/oxoprolinase family protein [Bacillota bacterium]
MRIGIDVGGTNTDAVLMDGRRVIAKIKTPTTEDVTSGITTAMRHVLSASGTDAARITAVMIGTTHFVNAVLERKHLAPTASVRLGLPATAALPPMSDWPTELRTAIGGHSFLAHGGREFDGRPISGVRPDELREIGRKIADLGITCIALSSVFAPVSADDEAEAAEILAAAVPGADITLSSEIGRMGMLERENAGILNACLRPLAQRTIRAFRQALAEQGIRAPLYLTQNDGTLMGAEYAERYPVLTFASGPTNSMRGAAFLSGLEDAMVVDIGGTSTDVGALIRGFPREASVAVRVGGVRTNFRMPDVFSIALGGGSIIGQDPWDIGPESVGFRITQRARVFGGDTLTTTDIAVASGAVTLGDGSRVAGLDADFVGRAVDRMHEMVEEAMDRMKLVAGDIPVILVGGGSILIQRKLRGASEIVKPDHFEAANAVGAAIAQISGDIDRVYNLAEMSREEALAAARREAVEKAAAAGADPDTVKIVDIEDIPLAYLPSNATRIRVKAVGDLAERGEVA